MKVLIVALLASVALASCSTATPQPPSEKAPAVAAGGENPVESVPLDVVVTGQTTSGRVILLRAKIVNPHAETVEGVRLQLVFLAPTEEGDHPKVLGIEQKEMGSTLTAGGSTMLRWDVESMYALDGGQFILAAYPKKLGDKMMPPPDNWKD
jgi:hypothetical protein